MNSVTEIIFILLLFAFWGTGMTFAYRLHELSCYIRRHHPQIVEEIKGLSPGARLRFLGDAIVFPHRRLRSELREEGIEDPRLEAMISTIVFWNRVTMVLFAFLVVFIVVVRWEDWT